MSQEENPDSRIFGNINSIVQLGEILVEKREKGQDNESKEAFLSEVLR